VHAAQAGFDVDPWLWPADPIDRGLWPAVATFAASGRREYTDRADRGGAAELEPACALDLSGGGSFRTADRGDGAHLDRRRCSAAALGAAAVALSPDLGAGVPVAAALAAQMDADGTALGDRGRRHPARVRWRAEPAADARRASALLLCHRHGLPWRTGADAAACDISDRLLCRAVLRRYAGRPVRRTDRALQLQLDRGISDLAGAGGTVPAARRRTPAGLDPLVLAVCCRGRGRPDRAVLFRRQDVGLARGSPRLGGRQCRHARRFAGAHLECQSLENLRDRGGGAGPDPPLSVGRRPRGNGAQLLRRAQDPCNAGRAISRADARHDDSRRAKISERRWLE